MARRKTVGWATDVEDKSAAVAALSTSGGEQHTGAAVAARRAAAADADEEDAESVMFSEVGDSRASSAADEQDDGAADEQDVGPATTRVQRATSPIYRTQLRPERLQFWRESHSQVGEFTGNIGVMFGNWGRVPSNRQKRERVELQLKNCPAQILCLAEAQECVDALLRSPSLTPSPAVAGDPDDSSAVADELASRPGFEYLTIRGREECSILVAVRATMARSLTCLHWERRFEGEEKKKKRYSRCMVCRVVFDKSIGHFGNEMVLMVVHMHNVLANGAWPSKLKGFWNWCWDLCRSCGVDVLMGDFNMSFFRVIPELRSRGARIDLAAWYPWKTPIGTPCSDSCGIFVLGKPGEYKLNIGIKSLHADDETGILAQAPTGFRTGPAAVADRAADPFDRHERNGGPGQPLSTYLPKKGDLVEKLGPSLEPSAESGAAVAALLHATKGAGKGKGAQPTLKVLEKRLDVNLWKIGNQHYKGSHFPVLFFTHNPGRRSPDKLEERRKKQLARRMERGYPRPAAVAAQGAEGGQPTAAGRPAAVAAKGDRGSWTRWEVSRGQGSADHWRGWHASNEP